MLCVLIVLEALFGSDDTANGLFTSFDVVILLFEKIFSLMILSHEGNTRMLELSSFGSFKEQQF